MHRNQHRVNENEGTEEYVPNKNTGKTSEKTRNEMEVIDMIKTVMVITIHEQSEESTKQITDLKNTTTELENRIKRFKSRINEQKGSVKLKTGQWNSSNPHSKKESMKKK